MMRRLPLAALAEEHDVVPGEDRVLDLGDDRVVVADDARAGCRSPRASVREQVAPHLLAHGEDLVSHPFELPERAHLFHLVYLPWRRKPRHYTRAIRAE